MVKQALSFDNFDAMPEGGQVNKLKFLVSSSFIHFECVFKGRDCNGAAHAMAELGYDCNGAALAMAELGYECTLGES
jgi:hypothetical protein